MFRMARLSADGGFPQLSIVPPHSIAPYNVTFDVKIWLNISQVPITFFCGWQIKLGYNTTVLNCTGGSLVPGHVFEDLYDQIGPPVINETDGTVLYMCAATADYARNVTETKPLCKLTFIGTDTGFSNLVFLEINMSGGTYLIDKNGYKIAFEPVSGDVAIVPWTHGVAVTNVTSSKTVVGQGYGLSINVTVANLGASAETFNVTLYAGLGSTINETGLVGYWKFDKGNGTMAYDSSGNGNDGTLINEPTWIEGKDGKALSFDGVDDCVKVLDSDSLDMSNVITISAWFKTNTIVKPSPDFGGDMGFISKDYSYMLGYQSFEDGTANASAWLLFSGEPWTRIVGPKLSTDTWYHEAVTFNCSTIRLYLNGMEVASLPHTGTLYTSVFPLGFGNRFVLWNPYSAAYFNGTMDEVKIYTRSMSAVEIWTEYASAPTAIQTQTVTLESGLSTTISFTWNPTGLAYGNYTVGAFAWPVPNESDTQDNFFSDGPVYVAVPGDINADGIVELMDFYHASNAYLSRPGKSNWNPNADINNDAIVEMMDFYIMSQHYLEHT
jgi:hypothetical protein